MTPPDTRTPDTKSGRKPLAVRLEAARREFIGEIAQGAGGTVAHGRFADRMDDLIRDAVAAAAPQARTPFAVAALGGYGRRALCLHSDIDLLLVFDGAVAKTDERFISAVLHPLWDLRLTLGHQVRSVTDLDTIDPDNPEFLLALLDARPIAGDRGVFARLHRRIDRAGSAHRETILTAMRELTARRHAEYNDTIYQLEPDVKASPGGLRDLMAARLLDSLAQAPDAIGSAAGLDAGQLDLAEDFLLRVRAVLHMEAGRNVNVLSHDLQETAAERLQCSGASTQQRVEGLMGRYFGQARGVARALTRAARAADAPAVPVPPAPAGPNLEVTADGVRFVDVGRAASEPASWLQAFEAALDRGVPIADEALTLIERLVHRRSTFDDVLPTSEDRRRLLRLLRPREGLYARLSELHECGLLDRLLPGFAAIWCRVIRDFWHKYTVDEHTLLTIRGLERLLRPDAGRERFAALLGELRAPERLVLALLFHDVGKWRDDESHAEESVRMARALLDRLGVESDGSLDGSMPGDVEFLIGQHLEMSRVAFRRDSEDPEVVRRFAALVGTEERLKMLCLLTLVDIEAVGTGTLTPWKEELLWRLYVDTYNHLTLAYGDEVIEPSQAAVAALQATRPVDVGERDLAQFLEGFPQRYLARFDRAHVYQHARLARDIHQDEVHLFLERKGEGSELAVRELGVWDLAVVTLDKPSLFSNICGTLAYCGMDILRGSAMTNPAGLVLDVFQFSDHEGFFRLNPGATAEFEARLQDVVAGRQDIAALLQRKENGPLYRRGPRRVAPVVSFDTTHSQQYTVLELVAQDALGLLHRVSRVIAQHGCDVDLVLMSTEGQRAIDVFHLTHGATKLSQAAQRALAHDLERMLEEES